jgi:hypothetical protein
MQGVAMNKIKNAETHLYIPRRVHRHHPFGIESSSAKGPDFLCLVHAILGLEVISGSAFGNRRFEQLCPFRLHVTSDKIS